MARPQQANQGKDAPAFDFYPERWLAATCDMSDAEQAAYLRLLCHQWLRDGLDDDDARLRRLGGRGATAGVLAKFPVAADGKRRNPRLESVRSDQRARIAKRRGAARARWDRCNADALHDETDVQCMDNADAMQMPPPTTHHPPPEETIERAPVPLAAFAADGSRSRPNADAIEDDSGNYRTPSQQQPRQGTRKAQHDSEGVPDAKRGSDEASGPKRDPRKTPVEELVGDLGPEWQAAPIRAALARWWAYRDATCGARGRLTADSLRLQLMDVTRNGRRPDELPAIVEASIMREQHRLYHDADRPRAATNGTPARRGRRDDPRPLAQQIQEDGF